MVASSPIRMTTVKTLTSGEGQASAMRGGDVGVDDIVAVEQQRSADVRPGAVMKSSASPRKWPRWLRYRRSPWRAVHVIEELAVFRAAARLAPLTAADAPPTAAPPMRPPVPATQTRPSPSTGC